METLPPVDAQFRPNGELRILLSSAADPQISDRSAVTVDFDGFKRARVMCEAKGAHRFVLPDRPQIANPVERVGLVTAGGSVRYCERATLVSTIDLTAPDSPEVYGMLTCSLSLSTEVVFGGMSRQLYVYALTDRTWTRLDEGVRDNDFEEDSSAFYGLGTYRDDSILAVGGGGEIWVRERSAWRRVDSGTNVMLNSVARLEDQRHMVCGAAGLLMVLTESGAVSVVDHPLTGSFFSSVVCFRGRNFLLSSDGLHVFSSDVEPRYLGAVDEGRQVRILASRADALCVVGSQAIGRTGDGRTWQWSACDEVDVVR